ncbi:MAG: hypothetical protein KF842_01990 [Caulobacter sp.]|nr:hypothetical protein [Caulobacter sp.]
MFVKPGGSPAEIAEKLQARRVRIMRVQAVLFVAWQAAFINNLRGLHSPLRTVDHLQLSGFAVWAAALMMLLATGGGWWRSRAVREILDDEVTRAHRASALAWGYWTLALSALGLYLAAQLVTIPAFESAHGLLTLGVLVPTLRFVFLERRSERNG